MINSAGVFHPKHSLLNFRPCSVNLLLIEATRMKLLFYTSIFIITTLVAKGFGQSGDSEDYESKLHAAILANLTKDVLSRPIQSSRNVTYVRVYTVITHIFGLDERTETLTVGGWLVYQWLDERVIWDAAKFGGLKRIRLSSDSLWKPMVYLYNSASFNDINKMYGPVPLVAYRDGMVRWAPPYTSQSVCAMDLRWFPFDTHECYLEFGAWMYSGKEVNFNPEDAVTKVFITKLVDVNNEWEFSKTSGEKHIIHTESDWHSIRFNISLRRRATYYNYFFILPSLIGIFLCLVIFWLPANLKFITGSINIFIQTLFIMHVFWVVPRSGSSVPNMIIIVGNTLALTGVSVLFSVVTVNLSHRTKPDLPKIIPEYLSGWLGIILCMRSPPILAKITTQVMGTNSDSTQSQVTDQSMKRPLKNVNAWVQLATAIDRIFFIIYCFTFFFIFIVTFTY